jgi:hypothetical protein
MTQMLQHPHVHQVCHECCLDDVAMPPVAAPATVVEPTSKAPAPPTAAGWYYTNDDNEWTAYDGVTTRLLQGSLTSGQVSACRCGDQRITSRVQVSCVLNHGAYAKPPPASTSDTSTTSKAPAVTGCRVDFGRLLEISRRTGVARHICCVPTPSQVAVIVQCRIRVRAVF